MDIAATVFACAGMAAALAVMARVLWRWLRLRDPDGSSTVGWFNLVGWFYFLWSQ